MTLTHINFLTATIKDLQILLRKGEITSVQLVQSHLVSSNSDITSYYVADRCPSLQNRIKENNEEGLQLQAVQDEPARVEKLFHIAKSLDDLRSQGVSANLRPRKDEADLVYFRRSSAICMGFRSSSRTASQQMRNSVSASLILRLYSACLLPLVRRHGHIRRKLRLTQFYPLLRRNGNRQTPRRRRHHPWQGDHERTFQFEGSAQKTGWSARGGQGQSAYVEGGYAAGGDPLGSSSGSAISVSAGFSAAALGAETVGSLVAPAARAALFALRPTMGLVSRNGTVPGASSLDVVGPMGKSAYDVALLLQHIAGSDVKDDSSECAQATSKLR